MFHFEVIDDSIPESPRTGRGNGEAVIEEEYSIGERIFDPEKNTGTVKYIGPVGKYPGNWLGIEWDNPARGKHSGSVDDKEYFLCSKANSGSFVRLHKAQKIVGIREALVRRYGHDEAVLSTLKSIEDGLERKKISYDQLKTLNLSGRGIEDSSEAEVAEILELCPNVEALELADNLITSWKFICSLCAGLPKLIRVDFSKNALSEVTTEDLDAFKDSFQNVDHVVLGSVKLDWSSVLKLSVLWPKVTNLQVPFNVIQTLTPPTSLLNVVRLDLEGNTINSWDEILKLTVLERLEYMNLCGNKLKTIRFPAELNDLHTSKTSTFSCLKSLNLTENSVDDWISVSELNKLKNLEELRIDLNPVLNKETRATNRQNIIARIGNIKKLEGVEINRHEKRDSEIDYLKRYSGKWETEKDSFRFEAEHPRYRELVEKWGQSEKQTATVEKTMKSSLIGVVLTSVEPSAHKPLTKKVMPTMNIQKLKGLIQRLFKEEEPPSKIVAVSSRNPGITFTIDDDFLDLASYSIEEGDKLLITW